MENEPSITIWDRCDPAVANAIEQFRDRWLPYSKSSRRYPIVRLMQDLVDPAVTIYVSTLPARYLGYMPGTGTGVSFSSVVRLVGLGAMVRLQRQLLRAFILTEDEQSSRDQRFIATLESLIELVWACARKRPKRTRAPGSNLNSQRLREFCRFCGEPAELTLFASGDNTPKAHDPDDDLRLSNLYCVNHRPKLPGDVWNPAYRRARRAVEQFDLELTRLRLQCAHRKEAQAWSGDELIDSYFFHYILSQTLQPADEAELRNQARLMVDEKLTDRKKQILALMRSGLNQSEIARRLGVERQAVSKALSTIPAMFRLN
ncbi:MAG: LuxR family transcriptional regulator [Rhodocyclaceae bacterium]